jgi:Fe-S-cluster containining protein
LEERQERIRKREQERSKQQLMVSVAPAIDKYKMTDLPDIDCAARLHLCRGRCCMLTFPLSFQDLDEGVVKWEYQRPYLIKHRHDDGYCVHNVEGSCGVYEHRPAICRSYTCKNDKRIWTDFERRIPAPWPNTFPDPGAPALHGERMDPKSPEQT